MADRMPGRTLLRRAVGHLSRRLERPELLAAFSRQVLQAEHEAVGIAAALAGVLRASSTYVDVGANRGQVLREAVRIAPGGRHVAFEPIPELARELGERFPDVQCRTKALGAQPGRAEFCHFRELDGWSGLRRNPEITDERGRPEFIEVEISTLDMEMEGLSPAVVKVDVEGAELAVLEGGRRVLSEVRPMLLLEHVPSTAELYGTSSSQLWALLDELDYAIFTATGAGPVSSAELPAFAHVVNWLARPQS